MKKLPFIVFETIMFLGGVFVGYQLVEMYFDYQNDWQHREEVLIELNKLDSLRKPYELPPTTGDRVKDRQAILDALNSI
jgi:hypothetical protein